MSTDTRQTRRVATPSEMRRLLKSPFMLLTHVVPAQELTRYEQKLQDLETKLAEAVFGKADDADK